MYDLYVYMQDNDVYREQCMYSSDELFQRSRLFWCLFPELPSQ